MPLCGLDFLPCSMWERARALERLRSRRPAVFSVYGGSREIRAAILQRQSRSSFGKCILDAVPYMCQPLPPQQACRSQNNYTEANVTMKLCKKTFSALFYSCAFNHAFVRFGVCRTEYQTNPALTGIILRPGTTVICVEAFVLGWGYVNPPWLHTIPAKPLHSLPQRVLAANPLPAS